MSTNIQVLSRTQHIVVDPATQHVTVSGASGSVVAIVNAGPPGPPGVPGLIGPQGPPGPVSSGQTFVFEQSTPSAEWLIPHNMNNFPSVTVVDSTGDVVDGIVTYLDRNSVRLTFSAAFSGTAYLN